MRDNEFEQVFTAHPVGQGFFYTGSLTFTFSSGHIKKYNFVFDCGSMNKVHCDDEVSKYNAAFVAQNEPLDLLIISHFDQDHISHIHKLLNERKVKNVIAPFIDFNERLVIALRVIEHSLVTQTDLGFDISFIMDPVGTLGAYLDDEDGNIILMNSDPEMPVFPITETEEPGENQLNPDSNWNLNVRNRSRELNRAEKETLQTENKKVTVLLDSVKPTIRLGNTDVLEFLFYRKSIGQQEELFYKKVFELFTEEFLPEFGDRKKPGINDIVEALKKIRHATIIRELFAEAKKSVPSLDINITDLKNMNTTALCVLIKNHASFYAFMRNRIKASVKPTIQCEEIKKFKTKVVGGWKTIYSDLWKIKGYFLYSMWYSYHIEFLNLRTFPGTMLTSDAFLLKENDVDLFTNRYKNYWNDFWLFQVPHHGSKNNADTALFKMIPTNRYLFINYGVKKEWPGRWCHPSEKVIDDLMLTGHEKKLIPVNEFNGIRYSLFLVW